MIEQKRKTRRRGNGEGSIFQRGDGKWVARIAAGYNHDGKRLRKTVYGATKKDVQEKLLELQQRKATGTLPATSKVTVAHHLERWLYDVARISVRGSTYKRYRELATLHVNTRIGGVRLHRLTAPDIQGVFSTMEENGLAGRTRQFTYDVVNMALAEAVRWGLVGVNVCDQISRPKARKPAMKYLDAAQAGAFLKAAAADRLSAMYTLALTVGMRQGELFGLQWGDVSLEAGRLSVRNTLNNDLELAPPKTEKSRRQIELPAMAVEELYNHKLAMEADDNDSSFVFSDSRGGPLRSQNILRRSFRPILKGAELPTIRFHDLRHTAATLMLLEGINAKVVSETLGHATVAFTLDTYAHVLPSMGKAAAAAMNRLFAVAT